MTARLCLALALMSSAVAAPAHASPAGDAPAVAAPGKLPIIGGTSTKVDQYPSVVALVIASNLCTGTLISSKWILTAAHCVDPLVLGLASQDEVTQSLRIHLHTVDVLSDPGVVVLARASYKDPEFQKSKLGSHDMGLIELEEEVLDVVPSPINLDARSAPAGVKVTTVGYGAQSAGAGADVGVELELVDRPSVSCASLNIGSDANLLCFSHANNMGTCQGDSGGPSFAMIDGKLTVVGVTSFGDEDCAKFGASTRVDVEQPFLVTHVPELIGCLEDDDCPRDRACFHHNCIAAPFSAGGIGAVCETADACESSVCAESSQDGKRCSITCSVSADDACPSGFECLKAEGDVGACWPSDSAGCCDAGGRGGPAAMALGFLTLVLARRRRRCCA